MGYEAGFMVSYNKCHQLIYTYNICSLWMPMTWEEAIIHDGSETQELTRR